MRPLIVYCDVTVDGFMAGLDNDLDFVVHDPELTDELTAELRSVADTIVWVESHLHPPRPTGQLRTATWPPG